MRRLVIMLIVLLGLIPVTMILAPNPGSSTGTFELGAPTSIIIGSKSGEREGGIEHYLEVEKVSFQPITETLDLRQVGSLGSPYIVNLTENFQLVDTISFKLRFVTSQFILTKFGDGSSLANGINIFYNSVSWISNENLTTNDALIDQAYEFVIFRDQQNSFQIQASWEFPPSFLSVTPTTALQFYVQDDITAIASVSEFTVRVNGFQTAYTPENPQDGPRGNPWQTFNDLAYLLLSQPYIWGLMLISIGVAFLAVSRFSKNFR